MARRGGFLWRIIDLVLICITLAVCAALILAYFAPRTNPNDAWLPAYPGLGGPILYIATFFLALYWAIRWRWIFFLPAILLLVGLPKIKLYYHFPFSKQYHEPEAQGNIKVMTFNVEGFLDYDEKSRRSISTAREITAFIRESNPDIICMQEFQSTPNITEESLNGMLSDWPYRRMGYSIEGAGGGRFGVALYSKYPITGSGHIHFEESNNGSLWADLLVGRRDTVRVICNHLETTYIDQNNVEFLNYYNFTNEIDKTGQIRQIAGRLRKGFRKRAGQADRVAELISSRELPTLVCGDFNDTPMSYSYRTIRGGFGDAFEEKGRGYGFTYKRLYRLLRIDFILPSPQLETLSYDSPDVPWSDHNPVVATFRLKRE